MSCANQKSIVLIIVTLLGHYKSAAWAVPFIFFEANTTPLRNLAGEVVLELQRNRPPLDPAIAEQLTPARGVLLAVPFVVFSGKLNQI